MTAFAYSIWNYLRVRGEYRPGSLPNSPNWELPPRARRIHFTSTIGDIDHGTTSACAENTENLWLLCEFTRNYLRVRGEYGSI